MPAHQSELVVVTAVSCAHWRPLNASCGVRVASNVVFRMSKSGVFTFPSSERSRMLVIDPMSASHRSDLPAVLIVMFPPWNASRLKLTDAPIARTSPSMTESETVRTALPSERSFPAAVAPSRFRADPRLAVSLPVFPAYRVIGQLLPTVELMRVRRPTPVIFTTARLHASEG